MDDRIPSLRALLPYFALLIHFGCSGPSTASEMPEEGDASASRIGRGSNALMCDEKPSAYVLSGNEASERTAKKLLEAAGFRVESLPLDRSPWELRGLILLGSYASERQDYEDYMKRYGADLYNFVDKANVLVQLAQREPAEQAPRFLPTTHGAVRGDVDLSSLTLLTPTSELVMGAQTEGNRLPFRGPGKVDSGFSAQDGFEVVIAGASGSASPALMEGAYGQGRFVLSALSIDVDDGQSQAEARFRRSFFQNLFTYTKNVCQRRTLPLGIVSDSSQGRFDPSSSMLAVLPDTQVYSLRYPGLFRTQTAWIVDHAMERDIRYVLHLGDIVNNNTDVEWMHAFDAMSELHGHVPYAILPGNHDYGPSGDASTRDTGLNTYFDFETHRALPGFGGAFEPGKLDNSYHYLTIGGRDYILLALEWAPRDEVLAWANEIMDKNVERDGIMITHAYLNNNNLRYDHTDKEHPQDYNPHEYRTPGSVNDGEEIWQKLIRRHRFVMTVNGHVLGDGAGYRTDVTDTGTTCHQILTNYQMRNLGGEGYMRLFEFMPDGRTVRVWAYSVLYDEFLEDPEHTFEFALD